MTDEMWFAGTQTQKAVDAINLHFATRKLCLLLCLTQKKLDDFFADNNVQKNRHDHFLTDFQEPFRWYLKCLEKEWSCFYVDWLQVQSHANLQKNMAKTEEIDKKVT